MCGRACLRAVPVAVLVVSAGLGLAGIACGDEGKAKAVRPASHAGSWYPGDREALAKEVDRDLDQAKPVDIKGKPLAVIAPHAGYRFSAPVAAAGYRCLRGQHYRRVMVMAFSHRWANGYQGVDIPQNLSAYQTPLGDVPIDQEAVDRLAKAGKLFTPHPGVDREEHSLELQLPFLQRVLKDFKLVPLLVGQMSTADYAAAAQAIVPLVDEDTLLVASSDFTHFGPNYDYVPFTEDLPNKLRQRGDEGAKPILACDFDGFADYLKKTGDTICGRGPISLLLRVLSMKAGAQGVRAGFDTSGNITGDWTNSVTYQSIVFIRSPGTLNEQEQGQLLKIARQTAAAFLRGKKPPGVDADKLPAGLREKGACFVTLQNRGQLRGCIGNMAATGPLHEAVIHNAVQACQDPRFVDNPVTPRELDEKIDVEISYLTPMKPVKSFEEIIVGRHGLLIELGNYRGVLLPQVAYERGWTREEFLGQVCRKAGLPLEAWKRAEAHLQSFTAEVFGEKELAMTRPAGE